MRLKEKWLGILRAIIVLYLINMSRAAKWLWKMHWKVWLCDYVVAIMISIEFWLLNFRPQDLEILRSKRSKTKELWLKYYPDEEFWPVKTKNYLNADADVQKDLSTRYPSYFNYDILAACARQKLFYYQVVLLIW